jgi:hypothetical protein
MANFACPQISQISTYFSPKNLRNLPHLRTVYGGGSRQGAVDLEPALALVLAGDSAGGT